MSVSASNYDNYVSSINTAISFMNKVQYEVHIEKLNQADLMQKLAFISCHYHRLKGMKRPRNARVKLLEPEWEMTDNIILCGR
jgi:hypothetical protein